MPSPEALDSMAQLIAGCNWSGVQYPSQRATVMQLALAQEHNHILDAVQGNLEDIHRELAELKTHVEIIADWSSTIGEWFEKSKLWEGEVYVTGG